MAFTWNKEWETGNALIDSEHKQLLQAINDLMEACSQGRGRNELHSITKFLKDYTNKHFSDEEKLQVQYQYPDYPNHKTYHETFKRTVDSLANQLETEGPSVALVGKINTSLSGWFINHIKREDVKVAAHIRAKTGK